MTETLAALALLVSAVAGGLRAVQALHMFQMDSYLSRRYLNWLRRKPAQRLLDTRSLVVAAALLALAMIPGVPAVVPLGAWIVHAAILLAPRKAPASKKPLDYTARATRILWTARILLGLAAALAFTASAGAPATIACSLALVHLAPGAVLLANQLLRPVQARINRGFVQRAERKVRDLSPVVIGVAGSYGKTTTKYFLDVLLSERVTALKTPGNVNTLLGVTRIVNENLTAAHKVFIVEMGAYKRGEVNEIAALVKPRIGIVTSIGPEHFDRFLTMANIEETNYEVIAALPPDGLAVFNCDNEHCRRLADRTRHTRVARYSLANHDALSDVWASEVAHSAEGLRFRVVTRGGASADAATPLVGRHNVLNILGAACIALEMGLTLDEIVAGIAKLRPAPNRLEVKKGAGGTIIIDDSYNSNPFGAAEALNVLSQFATGKRVLVTPGMIELGDLHQQENERFGYLASQVCDYVVLVGPEQTQPVAAGLRRGGFPEARLHVVKTLTEATQLFPKLLRPGDVILFENDLPDLYTES